MQCVASSAANQRLYFVAVQLFSVLQPLQASSQLSAAVFAFPPPSAESAPGGECRAKRFVRRAVSVRAEAASARAPDAASGKGERNSVCSEASGE